MNKKNYYPAMEYTYNASSILFRILQKIKDLSLEFYNLIIKSYKLSKITLFLQLINIFLFLYIGLYILPRVHLENILTILPELQNQWILYILYYQAGKLISSNLLSKDIGILKLLDTNLRLTLIIFATLTTLIIIYKFYLISIKNFVKDFIKNL